MIQTKRKITITMWKTKMKNKKVVLGLSGGVDSTTAALLLQEKGYEVIGLYFDAMGKGREDAGAVRAEMAAKQLGIKFLYRDVSNIFREKVIGNFCSEYVCGRTPNPCIVCNPDVKFKTLLAAADEEGADWIATGHYAGTYQDPESEEWFIRRAKSEAKDQSYMLYRLGEDVISRLILPLNDAEDKEAVREIARKKALKNAEDKDSQEICFIEDGDDYKAFLRRNGCDLPKGDFVDADGNILGEHQGILHYTIGQRKGLGIALGKPAFVTGIDSEKNQVVLGDNQDLFKTEVVSDGNILLGIDFSQLAQQEREARQADGESGEARSLGIIGFDDMSGITAKIRYAAKPAAASLKLLPDGKILTTFEEPQRAPTPGQSIVFYRDDLVLGGGFIV